MYLDRACMGSATPIIMREFHLDKIAMGWSVSAFNWTYALFQIPGGWLADRFGSRIVLTAAIMWWSIFTAATGGAFSAASLAVTRGLFGMGEAAAWPAASRSLLRWLPRRSARLRTGIPALGFSPRRGICAHPRGLSDCPFGLEIGILHFRTGGNSGGDRVVSLLPRVPAGPFRRESRGIADARRRAPRVPENQRRRFRGGASFAAAICGTSA